MKTKASLLLADPIVPLVTVDDESEVIPVASALMEGGLSTIEIALRSDTAIHAIEIIRTELPEMNVGAGTILSAGDVERAVAAGSQFLVSPGCTPTLLSAMEKCSLPFLPGVSTPGEIILASEYGLDFVKLFPVETIGGVSMLKALEGPFPKVRFCPTGGITQLNMKSYLDRDSVIAVGGSWLASRDLIAERNWTEITRLTRAALDFAQINER